MFEIFLRNHKHKLAMVDKRFYLPYEKFLSIIILKTRIPKICIMMTSCRYKHNLSYQH